MLTAKYVEQYWIAHYLMVNETTPATAGYTDQFPGLYSWDGYQNSTSMCLRLGPTCSMETILDITGYDKADIDALTDDLLLELINTPNITDGLDLPSIIGIYYIFQSLSYIFDIFYISFTSETIFSKFNQCVPLQTFLFLCFDHGNFNRFGFCFYLRWIGI